MNRDDITFRELFIHGWPAILAMVLWGAAILGALVALVVGAMGVMTLLLAASIITGRALI